MAWKDSAVDHAGGEGTWGEMFWAAVESAAFVEPDVDTLIRIGLEMVPLSSHIARSIREAVWCRAHGKTWGEARAKIDRWYGHCHQCNAVPNHAYTIIGWLYGEDFGDRLCKAVNCGYDTDCTGATLGALLGILDGTAGIPDRWREPIGEEIVLHKFTGPCEAPKTVGELTDRTVRLAEAAAARKDDVGFGESAELPPELRTRLFRNDAAVAARAQDNHAAVELLGDGREVWLHYGGEPVLRPGIGREVRVTLGPRGEAAADLRVPDGWRCEPTGTGRFRLFCDGPVADRNKVTVEMDGEAVEFTVLGPGEAQGVETGRTVDTCPNCRARVEACMCNR
jgi:hypothetical protein